jgi:hypothetical protein
LHGEAADVDKAQAPVAFSLFGELLPVLHSVAFGPSLDVMVVAHDEAEAESSGLVFALRRAVDVTSGRNGSGFADSR